jgi:hypothetical protein
MNNRTRKAISRFAPGRQFGEWRSLGVSFDKRASDCGFVILCKCSCGKQKLVRSSLLWRGNSLSCGHNNYKRVVNWVKGKKAYNRLPEGVAAFNSLYTSYKRNAKGRKLEFNLTREAFKELTKANCHYCGDPPSRQFPSNNTVSRHLKARKAYTTYTYSGIDRMDSSIGYEEENCVPCCTRCNYAKRNESYNDFTAWIRRIKAPRSGNTVFNP